jgi:hypothetical protein
MNTLKSNAKPMKIMEPTRVSARLRTKRINADTPTAADKAYIEAEKKRQAEIEVEKKRQAEIDLEKRINNTPQIQMLRRHLENAIEEEKNRQSDIDAEERINNNSKIRILKLKIEKERLNYIIREMEIEEERKQGIWRWDNYICE